MNRSELTGDGLMKALSTLANPHRLRVVATLADGRAYVSELARALGISRALLQVHLRKLEVAGLVTSQLELSEDGKAMKYYENTPFAFQLSPAEIARLVPTLTVEKDEPRAVSAARHTSDNGPPGPDATRDPDPGSSHSKGAPS